MNRRRSYRMVARAEAAEATHRRILDAAVALFRDHDPDHVTLEAIATRAGVTLQTVLRRFGSKDAVFAAAAQIEVARIVRSREPERPGDVRAALAVLIASYEETGDLNWRLLRFESQHPVLHEVLVTARANHRAWIEHTFAAQLPRRGGTRDHAIDLLYAATDFYVWKLFRIDFGRTRGETEATILRLLDAARSQVLTRSTR